MENCKITKTVIDFSKNNQGREYDKVKAGTLAKEFLTVLLLETRINLPRITHEVS